MSEADRQRLVAATARIIRELEAQLAAQREALHRLAAPPLMTQTPHPETEESVNG